MTSQSTTEPVIQLTDVTFSYGEEPILEEVDLTIHHREMIGIIGPNGSGKTTLLRLILGLLTPERGTVQVFGSAPGLVSRLIGYVPQHMQFDPSFPVSALDVVLMGLVGRAGFGPYPAPLKLKAREALATVEMADFAKRSFADLSGGQRQRVLIARALSTSPKLLLFDEPTANVDSSAGEKIYNLLDQLNQEMTILVVSHDIGFINHNISRVICVNRRIQVHPTKTLDGSNIKDIYGKDLAIIRHDQHFFGEKHSCSNF